MSRWPLCSQIINEQGGFDKTTSTETSLICCGCVWQKMAQSGRADRRLWSPLSELKRTSRSNRGVAAYDPKRRFATVN
jgi:hypothetical protein